MAIWEAVFSGFTYWNCSVSIVAAEWGSIYKAPAAFYLLPTRAWELLLGALTAIYLIRESTIGNSIVDGFSSGPCISVLSRGGECQADSALLAQNWLLELGGILGISLIAYAILYADSYSRRSLHYCIYFAPNFCRKDSGKPSDGWYWSC